MCFSLLKEVVSSHSSPAYSLRCVYLWVWMGLGVFDPSVGVLVDEESKPCQGKGA